MKRSLLISLMIFILAGCSGLPVSIPFLQTPAPAAGPQLTATPFSLPTLQASNTPDLFVINTTGPTTTPFTGTPLVTDTAVPVGELVPLDLRRTAGDRMAQIVEAARQASGSYHVLFLHTDGDGDYEAALRERFEPWRRGLADVAWQDERAVAVVPVREMEAWALCDGEALRGAFGSTLDDQRLGIPRRPADVEGVLDPKRMLQSAYERVFRPRRPKRSAAAALEAIAERARLDYLRQVPAFLRLENDLREALVGLRYLA